jgi:hypothetical protein
MALGVSDVLQAVGLDFKDLVLVQMSRAGNALGHGTSSRI